MQIYFNFSVIQTLGPKQDPDQQGPKILDADPH
jgi:hypothetical protein